MLPGCWVAGHGLEPWTRLSRLSLRGVGSRQCSTKPTNWRPAKDLSLGPADYEPGAPQGARLRARGQGLWVPASRLRGDRLRGNDPSEPALFIRISYHPSRSLLTR